jgi:hypothetical protein
LVYSYFGLLITIIMLYMLGLDRPVSVSSNNLFKGLPNLLRPFGLQFSIIFAILLLFIAVTCRSEFDLYLRSFSSTSPSFKSYKISSILLLSQRVNPAVLLKNFIPIEVYLFYPFFLTVQMVRASALCTFILVHFWTTVGYKVLFRISRS